MGFPRDHEHPARRTVIKAAGASALFAAGGGTAAHAAAGAPADLPARAVPGTGERLPVLGLGTFMTFDKRPGQPLDRQRAVLRRFWDGGGRVVDVSPLYGGSEAVVGDLAREAGITDRLFIADKLWTTGEYLSHDGHARERLARSKRLLSRGRLDLMQVHSLTNAEMNVPILRAWKREGHIRHLAVTHHVPAYFPALEHWVRTGDLDFLQVRYSIFMRDAEARLLPAAADAGTAVMVNMTLEKGRLHHLVAGRPLPGFAAEFGCATWTEFFLKYVLAHPAVTCLLVATTDPAHTAENLAAVRGPLPDRETRRRMVRHMRSIPGFADLDATPWYPGKTFDGYVRL